MGVPNVFGSATTSIPLSQLDANFNTPVTIGSTTVGLGNTTTTLAGLSNVSTTLLVATTANVTTTNLTNLTVTNDASISGLTVGKGGGAVASNTVAGYQALNSNTTASYNTAVGYQAGYSGTTAARNTLIGYLAGYSLTTGSSNTFIGGINSGASSTAGYFVTTGSNNTIIGNFDGNTGGLDIRTASNYIVLSDGDGNLRAYWNSRGVLTTANDNSDWTIYTNNSATSGAVYGIVANLNGQTPNNTTSQFYAAGDATNYKFRVYSNGGIANYQANNVNLSDETLKKDIQLAPNYLDKLCQIPVKTYLYKDQTDADLNLGVIAQDVKAICPELVGEMDIGKNDTDMKLAIYETDLKYAMLKAIQELKAEFDAYKATHP